jgi:hypothetical protein
MRVPRILFLVPGVLAGLLIPALTSSPKSPPPGAVGMVGTEFSRDTVTIHRDAKLTLFNSSDRVHIIGPGKGGEILSPERGVPIAGWHLMATNSVYTTGEWQTAGTFYLTCSVHPDMTLKVIVIP